MEFESTGNEHLEERRGRSLAISESTRRRRLARILEAHRRGHPAGRHLGGLAVWVLVVVGVSIGVSGLTLGWQRAHRAERDARAQQETAYAIRDLFQETLGPPHPRHVDDGVAVLDALHATTDALDGRFEESPAVDAAVRATLGETYLRFERYDDAKPLLEQSLATRRDALGDDDPDTARTMLLLARVHSELGELWSAEQLLTEAAPVLAASDPVGHGGLLVERARIAQRKGRPEDAEARLREAIEVWRGSAIDDASLAEVLLRLGTILGARGEFTEAESLLRHAVALRRAVFGPGHPRAAQSQRELAVVIARLTSPESEIESSDCHRALPRFEEAVLALERHYGPTHPATIDARRDLEFCRDKIGY